MNKGYLESIRLYSFVIWVYVIVYQFMFPIGITEGHPISQFIPIRIDIVGILAFISSFISDVIIRTKVNIKEKLNMNNLKNCLIVMMLLISSIGIASAVTVIDKQLVSDAGWFGEKIYKLTYDDGSIVYQVDKGLFLSIANPSAKTTIQGYKIYQDGSVTPASISTIRIAYTEYGSSVQTSYNTNPYIMSGGESGAYLITSSTPDGYAVFHSVAVNTDTFNFVAGNVVNVVAPDGGYVNVWWKYTPITTLSLPCGGYGDVDYDGYITNNDVQFILEYITELRSFTTDQKIRADVNANGMVETADTGLIQQYIKGLINTFPVCAPPSVTVNPPTSGIAAFISMIWAFLRSIFPFLPATM